MDRPNVDNAPGLVWRRRKDGWVATWQARTDLVKRGYLPKSVIIWSGVELSEIDKQLVADQCTQLQNEMLVWGRGGVPTVSQFDGTIASLVRCYQTDEQSTYRNLRHKSRVYYNELCSILLRAHAGEHVADIKGRTILQWYDGWTKSGEKIAMGHAMAGMVRTLMTFGKTMLESEDCARLQSILGDMRFKMAKPREERLSAEQVNAIRAAAHELGTPMIAIAQAFQFECMLRQKDVIGEWVPGDEPGLTDVWNNEGEKWLRGLRWQEIDSNLVLRHTTSKRLKDITVNLNLAPMVIEELAGFSGQLPGNGPVIIHQATGRPYRAQQFRTDWRAAAKKAGVPSWVRNMDSRAGAISEATDAGAHLEHVRHAATHGDISMTQRYSRGTAEKIEEVQKARLKHRNKTAEEESD